MLHFSIDLQIARYNSTLLRAGMPLVSARSAVLPA
jgi:hypothetical protein